MKDLSLEKMERIKGGCGYFEAGGVLSMGTLGVIAVSLGPIGWGAALVAGVGGMALTMYCTN